MTPEQERKKLSFSGESEYITSKKVEQERAEARKALDAALKGKWEATGEGWFNNPDCAKIVVKDAWGQTYVAQTYAGNHQVANAHLIANAPAWLRNSLDREEQLIADNERLQKHKDDGWKEAREAIEQSNKSADTQNKMIVFIRDENERLKEENISLLASGAIDANDNVKLRSKVTEQDKEIEKLKLALSRAITVLDAYENQS